MRREVTAPAVDRLYVESCSETAMLLGRLGSGLELWVHPYKLLDGLELSAEVEGVLVRLRDLARSVTFRYPVFEIHHADPSFRLTLTGCCPPDVAGGLVAAEIRCHRPVALWVHFRPVLAPMWPGGLGGQYLEWDPTVHAYVFGEASGKLWGLFGARGAEVPVPPPAHALPSGKQSLRVSAPAGETKITFIGVVGGERAGVYDQYGEASRSAAGLVRRSLSAGGRAADSTSRLVLPEKRIEDAFHWGKLSLRSGAVKHPTLGRSVVAGIGPSGTSLRPGFAWFFAGDASANMASLCAIGETELARDTLELFLGVQREDGKIPHETSQSAHLLDWFGGYPYAFYHGETTPWFLVATAQYLRWTGDLEFLKANWPRLLKAFSHCRSCDTDDDGLMENTAAGVGAAEVGPLRLNVGLDIYLASLSAAAARAMARMAAALGEHRTAKECSRVWADGRESLNARLWDARRQTFLYALDRKGKPRKEDNSWGAIALSLGVAAEAKAEAAWKQFAGSDLLTDWGARILSRRSRYYNPLHYNAGTVWPFLTGFVLQGGLSLHQLPSVLPILRSLASLTFTEQPGHITEVMSGEFACPVEASVPHQLFSVSGFVAGLVQGMMGIEPDILTNRLSIKPELPLLWQEADIAVPLPGRRVTVRWRFDRGHVGLDIQGVKGLNVLLQPRLGVLAPEVAACRLGRTDAPYTLFGTPGDWHASVPVQNVDRAGLGLRLDRYLDFLPETQPLAPGQENRGLKCLWSEGGTREVEVLAEGRPGFDYGLGVTSSHPVRVGGRTIPAGQSSLPIKFRGPDPTRFVKKTVTLRQQ
jgi:hypothetical protein